MPPDHTDLFRLVYRSRGAIAGTAEEVQATLDAILTVSRRRNTEAGITGALMFTRLLFVQALEGPADAVEATFDRVCCDLRHTNLEIVECGPVLERAFGAWSMSHLVPDAAAGALLDHVADEQELAEAATAAMRLMACLIGPSAIAPTFAERAARQT